MRALLFTLAYLLGTGCAVAITEPEADVLGVIPSSSKSDQATGGWRFEASGVDGGRGIRIVIADDPTYGVELNALNGGTLIEYYFPDGSHELVEAATGRSISVQPMTSRFQDDVIETLDHDLASYLDGKTDAIQDFYAGDIPAMISQCLGVFATLAECKRSGQYECTVLVNSRASVACAMRLEAVAPARSVSDDPSFRLNNRSDQNIVGLYVAPTSSASWGFDLLGASVLPPRYMYPVRRPRGQCTQDIRVVVSGRAYDKRRVNTCEISELSFPQDF